MGMFLRGGMEMRCVPPKWPPPPWGDRKSMKISLKNQLDFHWFYHRFGLPFGIQFGFNFDRKSKKIRLESIFKKTSEKYTFWGRNSNFRKSKNIAKPLEGCSKSHFSHIRNEVEKVAPRPLILESFLEPESSQDQKKGTRKRYKHQFEIQSDF